MEKERNIGEILLVKTDTKTLTHSENVSEHIAGMFTGEAVVTDAGGVIPNVASTFPDKFKIGVKLSSGKIQWSDLIDSKSVKSIDTHKYVATTVQLDYIGYNGTSGEVDTIDNNLYYVRMYMKPIDLAGFMQQSIKFGVYKSGESTTQYKIATGIAKSLIANLSREPEKILSGLDVIKVERVNSGTKTAVPTGSGSFTFTKGSKYFSATTIDDDTGTAALAVGDLLVIGDADSSPVYKIATIDTTEDVGTFDMVFQGDNATSAHGTLRVVTVANQASSDWGVKLTGTAHSFDPPKFNLTLPRWETTLADFGDTEVTVSQKTVEGVGDYRKVVMLEQQFQGNEGNYYRAQVPSPTFRSEAVTDGEYAMIIINHEDVMTGNLGNTEKSLKKTYIACQKGNDTVYGDDNTGLGTSLNKLITDFSVTHTYSDNATIATEINS